jgi:hypothetical protein
MEEGDTCQGMQESPEHGNNKETSFPRVCRKALKTSWHHDSEILIILTYIILR